MYRSINQILLISTTMSKPRVVHFLGELPGLGEELLHKLVCNNISCSIVENWYDDLVSNMSTELEIFTEKPFLFDVNLLNSNDVLLYFALNEQGIDFDLLSATECKVLLLVNGENSVDVERENLKLIYVHDLIFYSTISHESNLALDELLKHCISDTGDFDLQSDKKYWWVSQQDVAACLVRIIDNLELLSSRTDICGRRGWTESETFQQLELLYNRTMAGSSGQFQTNHLEPKPVIEATLAKASEITPSTRPDLSAINEALQQVDGEGWRPLIPLRTSLMHYLATKDLDYRV